MLWLYRHITAVMVQKCYIGRYSSQYSPFWEQCHSYLPLYFILFPNSQFERSCYIPPNTQRKKKRIHIRATIPSKNLAFSFGPYTLMTLFLPPDNIFVNISYHHIHFNSEVLFVHSPPIPNPFLLIPSLQYRGLLDIKIFVDFANFLSAM